jgi:C-terminal processing protease CtpA/Prc
MLQVTNRMNPGRRIGVLVIAACLGGVLPCSSMAAEAQALSKVEALEDLDFFCKFVEEEYAYFDARQTDWRRACHHARNTVPDSMRRDDLIPLLELTLGELYDHHAHLGTHRPTSTRLVPTDSQVYAQADAGKTMITDVRQDSDAWRAGLRPGAEIVSVDGEPTALAVQARGPKFLKHTDPAAATWALQNALAGRRDHGTHVLRVREGGVEREIVFGNTVRPPDQPLLHAQQFGDIAYLRIHNSLGERALVSRFDEALDSMPSARALVLDLRDTPSGGTSTVARGLMGRLVTESRPYQRHELVSELRETGIARVWTEHVAPRGRPFRGPVVVLVGRWTASMGEGIAIGLNAARNATVVGRPMAHLLGALGEARLPHSGIVVRVPVEKMFHVNGTPREKFRLLPIATGRESTADDELRFALALARKQAIRARAAR